MNVLFVNAHNVPQLSNAAMKGHSHGDKTVTIRRRFLDIANVRFPSVPPALVFEF